MNTGWPQTIKELPEQLKPYFAFRDELAVEDGIIMKGRQVIIPSAIQADILHRGHQGIEKTRQLARDTVYWPGINNDILKLCETWYACDVHHENNRKLLETHNVLSKPWQAIASDLFDVQGKQYLLIVDRYPLVNQLPTATSMVVANKFGESVSIFGS